MAAKLASIKLKTRLRFLLFGSLVKNSNLLDDFSICSRVHVNTECNIKRACVLVCARLMMSRYFSYFYVVYGFSRFAAAAQPSSVHALQEIYIVLCIAKIECNARARTPHM